MFTEMDCDVRYRGYNPEFVRKAQENIRRREMERAKRERLEAREKALKYAKLLVQMGESGVRPDARIIIREAAEKFGYSPADIIGPRRQKALLDARFAIVRIVANARPDMSLLQLGRLFKRDHTTILNALRKTQKDGQER